MLRWRIALDAALFVAAACMFFIANNFLWGVVCFIPASLICLGLPTKRAPHSEYYKKRIN